MRALGHDGRRQSCWRLQGILELAGVFGGAELFTGHDMGLHISQHTDSRFCYLWDPTLRLASGRHVQICRRRAGVL
jgi:hypothetical protein